MNKFFIIGLPRSQTAWLANYFTMPGLSICHHEGLLRYKSFDKMAHALDHDDLIAGDSDSGLCLFPEEVIEQSNYSKILIIKRSVDECRVSYQKAMKNYSLDANYIIDECLSGLQQIEKNTHNIVIPFENLLDKKYFKKVHEYILGDIAFSAERFEILKYLRVTQKIQEVQELWHLEQQH